MAKLTGKAKKLRIGAIIAPNFALGALLLIKYSADAARYFPQAEIIEMHHDQKADAPSGTAIITAQVIKQTHDKFKLKAAPKVKSKESIKGTLGGKVGQVPIHSVRLPGFVATQEVVLGGVGQTLRLRHETINRESFMPGVLLAVKKVIGLKELVYGLEKLL